MSDTTQAEASAESVAPTPDFVIPVVKSKGSVTFTAEDLQALPEAVYRELIIQGLKVLVNRGMSKITKNSTKDEAELKTLAQEAAEKNVEAIKAGKIKYSAGAGKAKKTSGKVMTEAMRLARTAVKDDIKRGGGKVSHYEASEITKAAKAYIEADPSFITKAEANLAEREATPTPAKINLAELIKASPKLVAAAEAKKSKAGTISAKQAGMPAKRKKGQAEATAH